MKPLFTDKDANTWAGGSYELAIALGSRSDARLETALMILWQDGRLEGCYLKHNIEPSEQQRVEPSLRLLEYGQLYGIATMPGGCKVACGTFAVREEGGIDWLGLYITMGALSTAYDVGAFPSDGKASQAWREPLDEWLVEVAHAVFALALFALALVGHEVSGTVYAAAVAEKGIPVERWYGYLWQEKGELMWYPPTHYRASFIVGATAGFS